MLMNHAPEICFLEYCIIYLVLNHKYNLKRIIPLIISLVTLCVILYTIWISLTQPESGVHWSFTTGDVIWTDCSDDDCPIRIGDQVLTVDAEPVSSVLAHFNGKQTGDYVAIEFKRNGMVHSTSLELLAPSKAISSRIIPLIVAFTFCILGFVLSIFSIPGREGQILLVIFIQSVALTLSTGGVSSFAGIITTRSFVILRIIAGPIALHTHLQIFHPDKELKRSFLALLYGFTVLLLPIQLFMPISSRLMTITGYGWLGGNLLIITVVLFRIYTNSLFINMRRKSGIILLALGICLGSFSVISVLPQALLTRPLITDNISFMILLLIPTSYGYAIYQDDLIHLERKVNRSVAIIFVVMIMVLIYTLSYYGLVNLFPLDDFNFSSWGLGITILLVALSNPLYRLFLSFIDRFLYSGWYDHLSVIQRTSRSIIQAGTEPVDIARTLCNSLCSTMKLSWAGMLLENGTLILNQDKNNRSNNLTHHRIEDSTVAHFRSWMEVSTKNNSTGLETHMADEVTAIFPFPEIKLLQPLRSEDNWLGVLALGSKPGNDPFTKQDIDILETILSQTEIALENARNLDRIEGLHRKMMIARDEERRSIARKLHDRAIQSLIGLNYTLEKGGEQSYELLVAKSQSQVLETIATLRTICSDLRPPVLDVVGLVAAIHSSIEELQYNCDIEMQLHISGNDSKAIPEGLAECIYHCYQEAMRNVFRHAQASQVAVFLLFEDRHLGLIVRDDGVGFSVPSRLEILSEEQHFGLIGINEMVLLEGGTLEIQTSPDSGCTLTIMIPYEP